MTHVHRTDAQLAHHGFPYSPRTCGHAVPASRGWWATCFGFLLLATMLLVVFSARYESHFMVLLRRGRYDPVVSSQPASPMDFTRPDITEEELNSEVELLRDEDLLKQAVKLAGIVPADTPDSERPSEIEHAVRKLSRRLDVEALKKSNLIQVSYKDTSRGASRSNTRGAFNRLHAAAHEFAAAAGRDSILRSSKPRRTKNDCMSPKASWCSLLGLGEWYRRRWNGTSRCRS